MATQGSSPETDLGLHEPPAVGKVRNHPTRPPKLPSKRNCPDADDEQDDAGCSTTPADSQEKARCVTPPPPPPEPESTPAESKTAKTPGRKNQKDEHPARGNGLRSLGAAFLSAVVHLLVCIVLAITALPSLMREGSTEILVDVAAESEETIDDFEVNELVEAASSSISVVDVQSQLDGSSQGIGDSIGSIGLDRQVADQASQAIAVAGVNIDGPDFGLPNTAALIGDVPDGALGDPRAIVDGYDEAIDRIAQEVLWMLAKSDVLLIWCFDQSESMKDDQKEIRGRIAHVYEQLGLRRAAAGDHLTSAVTSYGQGFLTHTKRPTSSVTEIRAAIDTVPVDPSGKEMMCSAVATSIGEHLDYAKKTDRQMALVLVTDETGEKPDNLAYLEATIAVAREAKCRVYILGREAVFGYPYAHMKWRHPYTGHVHWLPVDRGPETAFVEQLQTDGFRRRYDAHPSGFGPYGQSRLARETGGIFFALPSLETNIVRGEKRRYELEAMRIYQPDLRHRAPIVEQRNNSVLRSTLWKIINDMNPYDENVAKFMELEYSFPVRPDRFAAKVRAEQQKKLIYLNYLDQAAKALEAIRSYRNKELSPRWQANYDLIYAQLLAYTARCYEYGVYLEQFIRNPKHVPFEKPKFLRHTSWRIRTTTKTVGGELTDSYIQRSTEMFQQVIRDHPGTPWAARAELELQRGFGFELQEHYTYYGPRAPSKPSSTPRPKIPIPKL